MLVKLGDVWVDPVRVVTIHPSYYDVHASIRDQYQAAFFKLGSFPSEDEAKNGANEYAAIINNAVGSSYGGVDEEETADA